MKEKSRGILYVLPVVLLLFIFFLFPLFNVLRMSLMEGTILGSNRFVGFANYKTVFLTNEFWQSLGNTVIYSLIVTPMIFIPAILCAVWLKRQSFSHSILRTVLFIPCAISLVASSYIWSWILNDTYGLLNYILRALKILSKGKNWLGSTWSSRFMISVSVAWKTFGMSMIILLAGLSAISPSITEAAKIDGASKPRILFSITIPLVRPTLALALIMSVAGSFKGYDQFVIMTGGGPMRTTQSIVMYINKVAFEYYKLGESATISVVFLIILFTLSYYQNKLGGYEND